jgi:mRNA interferase MazF
MAIVCPITSCVRPFSTSVVLPAGLPIHGQALIGHVRNIDLPARPVRAINASAPPTTLAEVRAKLAALTGIDG